MRCPACQQPTFETADSCPQCGFSLSALEKLLGIPPTLNPDVTDIADELTSSEIKGVQSSLARLKRRFPQVRGAVVVSVPPPDTPLSLYAFWLFNKGGLTSAVERGGSNRLVLIVLDPEAGKLACMIGYGLEPYVSEGRLAACLQAGLAGLASGEPGVGLEACIEELERHLAEVATNLQLGFGIGNEYEHLEQLTAAADAPALQY